MKTKFTTIIAAVALLVSTSTLTFAGVKTDDSAAVSSTEIKGIGKISSIEASGNVDVYIMNGDYDAVKVYSDYYGENAVVQNVDGVLHIASYSDDKLMVLVTVNDLKAITANDEAFVKTYGDALSAKGLSIELNDEAVAVLKLDALAAEIKVNDKAHADLYGSVENYELSYSPLATINKDQLASFVSKTKKIEKPKFSHLHAFARFRNNAPILN